MRRRDFIRSIGGAAMAWLPAPQPAKLPTIGFLGPNTPAARSQSAAAFVQRLREFGWIEQSECKLFGTVV
jgi:putative ABC transport system substrate-binding protein